MLYAVAKMKAGVLRRRIGSTPNDDNDFYQHDNMNLIIIINFNNKTH